MLLMMGLPFTCFVGWKWKGKVSLSSWVGSEGDLDLAEGRSELDLSLIPKVRHNSLSSTLNLTCSIRQIESWTKSNF